MNEVTEVQARASHSTRLHPKNSLQEKRDNLNLSKILLELKQVKLINRIASKWLAENFDHQGRFKFDDELSPDDVCLLVMGAEDKLTDLVEQLGEVV